MGRVTVDRFHATPPSSGARVSIVIPCFNYGRYLRACVESVMQQGGVDVDVVIVDDASTDDSVAIARTLAAEFPRIEVLSNERNSGAVETFNRGLANAEGEFIVRLDADDLLTPGSLARSVAVLQAHPDVGLVYGHPLHFEGDALPTPRSQSKGWLVWSGGAWLTSRFTDGTNVITSPEAVMRRSIVSKVGGQKALAHTHDFEMWMRMASVSDVAYIVGADQAWHREHAASLSTQAEDPLLSLEELGRAFETLASSAFIGPERARVLLRLSTRAVALEALAQARRLLDRGSSPQGVDALLAFARASDATIESSAQWRRCVMLLERSGRSTAMVRLRGVVARLARRLRSVRRHRRWERTGVFERIHIRQSRRMVVGR